MSNSIEAIEKAFTSFLSPSYDIKDISESAYKSQDKNNKLLKYSKFDANNVLIEIEAAKLKQEKYDKIVQAFIVLMDGLTETDIVQVTGLSKDIVIDIIKTRKIAYDLSK